MNKPQPFEISIADAQLEDLRSRLERTRWSPEFANDDWGYGTNGSWLRELVDYWLDGYDWREQERALNSFPNFRVTIDDVPIHFIHARGKGPDPTPIILSHGWPWTYWDWHEVIPRLTDPEAFGGDPAKSFDVIVPSLPGWAFSNPLTKTGITPVVIAELWDRLMREVLGYERFGAAGGDWGSVVTQELGINHAASLLGVYLSQPPVLSVPGGIDALRPEHFAPEEAGWFERAQRKWETTVPSHLLAHRCDPQSLAWAFNDSPVGLASWILERRHNWCDGEFEKAFSRDFLLTTVCLYWFTESIGTSMRLYAETWPSGLRHPVGGGADVFDRARGRIEAPTGIGVFLGEVTLLPRTICEQVCNLVHWTVHPEGGHFGPAEQPEAYAKDLHTFFGNL